MARTGSGDQPNRKTIISNKTVSFGANGPREAAVMRMNVFTSETETSERLSFTFSRPQIRFECFKMWVAINQFKAKLRM
jgi:hypothetical protein